jgi:hypothetical protein
MGPTISRDSAGARVSARCILRRRGDLVFRGNIAQDAERLAAGCGQGVGGGAQRVFVDVGQDHGGAALGEGLRGG